MERIVLSGGDHVGGVISVAVFMLARYRSFGMSSCQNQPAINTYNSVTPSIYHTLYPYRYY